MYIYFNDTQFVLKHQLPIRINYNCDKRGYGNKTNTPCIYTIQFSSKTPLKNNTHHLHIQIQTFSVA